ncbi:hypothetical protein Q5P01_011626 [Channa striata]|uniref:Uncharacterized protein n=1 Tax=Channa striata TaxID=64152 RepID=A0AA88MZU3_CHASR|nr:hypothetical protein Q5P01_011626 [Channa striata]
MASTPSASALSAVLRCRGNIWTRNTPTKRPATAAYSLGLAGGALRDSPDERTGPNQEPAWEAFVNGERVVVTRRLRVTHRPPRVAGNTLRENGFSGRETFGHVELSQLPGDAHSAARGVQNRLTRDRPTRTKIRFKYETYAANICNIVFAREISSSRAGVLKVSLRGNAGQLVKTLRRTCLTLTELVSEFMRLWSFSSSSSDGASHLQCQQHEEKIKHKVPQANEHRPTDLTSSKGGFDYGQKVTEDRPD